MPDELKLRAENAEDILGLQRAAVAVGFFDSPPDGLPRWQGGAVAAGCVFWKKAQEGSSFYTVSSDHYNCAVGAHTHGLRLPSERSNELNATISFMVDNGYLTRSEIPGIPTLPEGSKFIAYGPAQSPGFLPDLVIVAADPQQAMLLYEAALRVGAGDAIAQLFGRPACAILALTRASGKMTLSLGCKGNRTFTGLSHNEAYICVPASKWDALVGCLGGILDANETMGRHYVKQSERIIEFKEDEHAS
jgi:uncharacterized protein (DUF169 family)